jgi:tetratricopeptide (TPR) repeat protein
LSRPEAQPGSRLGIGAGFVLVVLLGAVAAGLLWQAGPVRIAQVRGDGALGDAAQAEIERGAGFMGQFEFSNAEECFEAASALAPESWIPTFNRAVARMNRTDEGAQREAIVMLEPLVARPEARLRAMYCQGLAALYLGEPAEAQPRLAEVAKAMPGDAYAQFYAAQCHELLGEHGAARAGYQAAATLDPLLRSAYLGVQRTAARLGDEAAAAAALARFESLTDDLRSSLAEFKYTRMGPLAEVVIETEREALSNAVAQRPAGERDVFGPPGELPIEGRSEAWGVLAWRPPTVADVNGDGALDLVFAARQGAVGAVCLGTAGDGGWRVAEGHPMAAVPARGLLWADLDNDGRLDAVVNPDPSGAPFAMLQEGDATWTRRSLGTSDGCSALLLADLDYDGDVDVLASDDEGPLALLNRDGRSFESRPLAQDAPMKGRVVHATGASLGGDGELQLLLTRQTTEGPRVEVWAARPLWVWERIGDWQPIGMARGAVAARDGLGGSVLAALVESDTEDTCDTLAVWQVEPHGLREIFRRPMRGAQDLTLGHLDSWADPLLLVTGTTPGSPDSAGSPSQPGPTFARVLDLRGQTLQKLDGSDTLRLDHATIAVLDAAGPRLLVPAREGASPPQSLASSDDPVTRALISFRGRIDPSQQMRSNASGLGTMYSVRSGGCWVEGLTLPATTVGGGLQQSLQPSVVGLCGAERARFAAVRWPDGVVQTERDLGPGMQTLVETQRQISSCPVIFAWDGLRHRFVTDCLGVGGIGYLSSIERDAAGRLCAAAAPPRPRESVALGPGPALVPLQGEYSLWLTEPMEEACYLDAARLVAYDLPDGWAMTLDERMGMAGPEPTGRALAYRRMAAPQRALAAVGSDERDVLDAVTAADGRAAWLGEPDPRFIGRLRSEATLTLGFESAIDAHEGQPTLVMEGWVEYPYGQTHFAMWQANAVAQAPSLEALDPETGEWRMLAEQYGYPAGMPRQAAFPVPMGKLPRGCTELRLRTTAEVYVDALRIVWVEPCPDLVRVEAPLAGATCEAVGYARRTTLAQRRPHYDFERRAPLWDCRMQPGQYTALGECTPLVAEADDALAIFGAGEGVRLRFGQVSDPPAGHHRTWVLELDGWCKDMDRYTLQGSRLEPLPSADRKSGARDRLHPLFNTRYAGGM